MENSTYNRLLERLRQTDTAAVAFSGGVDSTFLLAAAREAFDGRVLALTAVMPYMVRQEIGDAVALAQAMGVRHELVEAAMPEGIDTNPRDRCYLCKRALYARLMAVAEAAGFQPIIDGSNVDDLKDFRPGMRALRELGVRSPLLDCDIDKADVRRLSRTLNLPTWSKPTNSCLLTRLPAGKRFSMAALQRIEEAERFLAGRGYDWVRVRMYGDLARIEVAPEQRARMLDDAGAVIEGLEALGFRDVALDLHGYRLGSMNPEL
jgi:pyridinium-3,5-biscarboxylic acid mononucleotide sulfurtransferase